MENRAEQLLESYFANSISSTELEELRALAAADAAVADEIAFQQRIAASVQKAALAEGIQDPAWRNTAEKPVSGAKKVFMFPGYAYAVAAALALLVVAYIFLMPQDLPTLVAKNTKEYPNKMKFKSLGEEAQAVPEAVIQAFSLYDHKQFREAATALQPIVGANADRMDYRFYWGVSLVNSQQYAAAVYALTPLVQSSDERKIPAQYYLGLACAGSGDLTCARQNLQAYIDSPEGVSYREQAKKVLSAL
jgi:hypothetical protein